MLQLCLGLQLLGQFPWIRACWGHRQCWDRQLTSGMAPQIPLQTAGAGTQSSLGEGIFLTKTRWSFSSELTGIQGAAPSHAISQLSLPLKFQIGRGIKWLNTSCRTSIFFFSPKASSTLFYKLWFSITARTTLAKSSTFDSFYLDVDMWFLYS